MATFLDVRLQFYIHLVSSFLSMVISGMAVIWISPLTEWFSSKESAVPMTEAEVSWMVSLAPVGAMVGAIPAGILSDRSGRKPVLLASGVILTSSWAVTLMTKTMSALFLCQVLNGAMVGSLISVVPTYLSEISPPETRGAIVGQLNTMFGLGQVVVYAIGPVLQYDQYLLACFSLPLLFVVMIAFAPESPYYLYGKGKRKEAVSNMVKLRGEGSLVELETGHKKTPEFVDDTTIWQVLGQNGHIKSLICLMVLSVVSQSNGSAALSIYSEQFVGGRWVTLVMGVLFMTVSLVASLFTDPCGRRPLLFLSTVGSAIFTGILTLYFLTNKAMLLYLGVFGFCVVSSVGINPLIMTLPSELFPTRLRALANALSQVIAAIAASATVKLFVPINGIWGVQANFAIATLVSLAGAFATIFIPETARTTIGST